MAIKKLGHVGIYCQDIENQRRFYTEVVGLKIADEDAGLGAVFMSSNPENEHHEFVLFRAKSDQERSCVQQISFSCESPEDIVNYYHRFKEHGVRFDRVVSHGNAIGLYFYDPEGNRCEVYWTTPFQAHQPYAVAADLTKPLAEVIAEIEADVRQHASTGHRDPESFVRQKEQLAADGVRV
ncbi:MAG TPA: VOC family protein [Chloroflexota bacterium]|nr:VOC family protein [Chloroflexota bacterium]